MPLPLPPSAPWPQVVADSSDKRSTVRCSLEGGQVVSWAHRGRERLFLSQLAAFGDGKAIRGGVPVIFPQFGMLGPGQRHGFARLSTWKLRETGEEPANCHASTAEACIRMVLEGTPDNRPDWPHPFTLALAVSLGSDSLSIRLSVTNNGETEPFTFTAALHTYLAVGDISNTSLQGLEGCGYLDATRGNAPLLQRERDLRFEGEVDRVYLSAPSELLLRDGDDGLRVLQAGFRDTVVWNPGSDVARQIGDLSAGDYRRFVCVEAAAVGTPIGLAPGESWHGSQTLIG